MDRFASARVSPCYAVIFTSQRTAIDAQGYARAAERMVELARSQPGFLGIDSTRDADGFGITVSYWESLAAIRAWKQHAEHLEVQALGRSRWYAHFNLSIVRVESSRSYERTSTADDG